jgi:hypothetical protein
MAITKRKRNAKQSKGKTALKTTGRAIKKAASSVLGAGSAILGAGSKALANPKRRIKLRNRYIDIVIKGQAKKTPKGWKVGRKTFEQGRGTVAVSSGYYLDRATGFVYAKRERNAAKRKTRKRNVEGFYDPSGVFHPIRAATDYDRTVAGETGKKPRRTRSKKRLSAKRKASATARHRSLVRTRKAKTSRLASRAIKKSSGLLKRGRKNPSAKQIREKFAGSVNGERDLYFPQGTPGGKLAKLGKLVLIETEKGTIKPVAGTAWLCADEREKLYIGSTSPNPLFSGPARSLGKVKKVEYESSKPHLGYAGPIIWFHHMGEKGGVKPTLHADGKGGLVFKGGNYTLTERGIEH